VRKAIQAFNARAVTTLRHGSHRPKMIQAAFDAAGAEPPIAPAANDGRTKSSTSTSALMW